MQELHPSNGIIYCRVSSLEQVDNTSLESQEVRCKEYASREGIEVVKVFIERGESAKTKDRTEFTKAITFCTDKVNKVGHFIVFKLDRFSRNQDDHAIVRAVLKRHGVSLRSATEPIDQTPAGRLMEGVISSVAEFDNSIRTERSKGGMMEKLKKGIWMWNAPTGYYRPSLGSNLAPDPSIAPYVRMIFEEYAKGTYTYKSLAEYVTARGYRTKSGKGIRMQQVDKMLKNPLYCGRIKTWGIDIKGDFEALIGEDLFDQCQKGYKKKYLKVNRSVQNPDFPLRRFSICMECGKSLTGSTSTGRYGVKYSYYHHHKQGCSKAQSIPRELFEKLFVAYLKEITPSLKYEKIFNAVVVDLWQSNYKKLDENNVRIRQEIERLEIERQKVFDLHRLGKYSDEEFIEQKSHVIGRINEKRRLLQDNHLEEFNMEEALSYCFDFVRDTAGTWSRLKKKDYARLLRFQKQIFPENIMFNGEKFGTSELSLVYKINQQSGADKSQLVPPRGIEPRIAA